MAVNKGEIGIYGVLKRDGGDGVIATADQIKDTLRGLMQEDLNTEYHTAKLSLQDHLEDTNNPHSVTKALVGLDNVTNDALVKRSELGKASGVATLDTSGKVPTSLLPSFVNNVLEYDTLSKFPTKGEDSKIYITLDTNLTYRWSGTQYVEISPSLAVGETADSAFAGSRGKAVETNLQLEITDRLTANTTLQTNIDNLSKTVTNNKTATDSAISDVNTALSNYKTEVANSYLPLTGGTISNSLNVTGTLTTGGKNVLTSHQSIYKLTLQKNGSNVGTFTPTNSDSTLDISVPTKVSDLTDDVVSGKYLPLIGGTILNNLVVNGKITQGGNNVLDISTTNISDNTIKINNVSRTIPTKLSELTNDIVEACTTDEINSLFV